MTDEETEKAIQTAIRAGLQERFKTDPGGVVSTQPANDLKTIKFGRVYSKAWQVKLPSGWTAWVDRIDVQRTYLTMLDGLPELDITDKEIEEARTFVRENFHGPEPVVIPPKLYDEKSSSPILPPLRFAASISTFEPLTDEDDGSRMNLIWFTEIDDDKSVKDFVTEALSQVDWGRNATGFSI